MAVTAEEGGLVPTTWVVCCSEDRNAHSAPNCILYQWASKCIREGGDILHDQDRRFRELTATPKNHVRRCIIGR